MQKQGSEKERRRKHRFPMQRELRFKVLIADEVAMIGVGQTIDISSGGVAFENLTARQVPFGTGALLEISISWPILLGQTCPLRLIVFGQLVRMHRNVLVCSIARYEFRTQARNSPASIPPLVRGAIRPWPETPPREIKAVARA